jgi:hypothetical protein
MRRPGPASPGRGRAVRSFVLSRRSRAFCRRVSSWWVFVALVGRSWDCSTGNRAGRLRWVRPAGRPDDARCGPGRWGLTCSSGPIRTDCSLPATGGGPNRCFALACEVVSTMPSVPPNGEGLHHDSADAGSVLLKVFENNYFRRFTSRKIRSTLFRVPWRSV